MPTFHWMLCLLALGLAASPLSSAEEPANLDRDWPQWRGPHRDGQWRGTPWPDSLDDQHLTLRWRIPLEPSYSGPLVVGDRVFVTETRNERDEVVSCLSRDGGQVLWTVQWPGAMSVPFFARANGDWIRSTPAYADGRLFVAGMRDTLHCLDAATGSVVWQMDFVKELKTELPAFGCVCSPLVVGDHVYLQAGAALLKLEAATGRILWRKLDDGGGMNGSAFSSPCLARVGRSEQLLVQTRTHLCGVDPEGGELLWKQEVPAFRGMNILTPTVLQDAVFTSTYGGKSFLYRLGETPSGWQTTLAWDHKVQGYMSSPVVIDGHAYLHLRNQRFTCIDLTTGESRWTTEPFGRYWSLIAQGDRILALDEAGMLRLIRATPEKFDLLSERKVSDQECWAHLAVAGADVVVRELNGLAVYRWAEVPQR